MRPEQLHLTLVFLGEVDARRVDAISESLEQVAVRHRPFLMSVNGAGGRVDDRRDARPGGVAWLTFGAGATETAQLALDADAAIGARSYDERRRPRPHLTIARAVDAPVLAAVHEVAQSLRLEWRTTRIVLFRSHAGSGGSRYDALKVIDLSGAS